MSRVIRLSARLGTRIGTGLWHALRRLDDHWIGDLIGALCLFGMLWMGLFAAAVFQ